MRVNAGGTCEAQHAERLRCAALARACTAQPRARGARAMALSLVWAGGRALSALPCSAPASACSSVLLPDAGAPSSSVSRPGARRPLVRSRMRSRCRPSPTRPAATSGACAARSQGPDNDA